MKKLLLLVCLLLTTAFSQYEDTGKRGLYFPKKTYSGVTIPDYAAVKDQLPVPFVEDNPEWVALYWRAWELAFNHYKKPPTGSPLVSDYIDEAFAPQIFQWDTIFMIMFARYAHHLFPCIMSLDNFYCRQYENGYICREIEEATGKDFVYKGRENTVNPPLFSWAELEYAKVSGDTSRYRTILPALEKYAEWLGKYRVKQGTAHGLYWQTGLGSGMDNTPRKGSGWVDMSAQMAMFYRDVSWLAGRCGENEKAEAFAKRYKLLSEKINSFMWNNEDGMYYDVDDQGKQIKCKTIASFWPLLAGIATNEQALRMMVHLKTTTEFWREVPFPSLSADQPEYKADGEYWVGSVWAPTNMMVIKGLEQYKQVYNAAEFCNAASEKYVDAIAKVYKRTGTIWENYAPDMTMRGVWSKPDFVGWSGCGPITLLIENIIGIIPDAGNNVVHWTVTRRDRHGLKNLHFGNTIASFTCNARESILQELRIAVTSDKTFTLIISREYGKEQSFTIHPGSNSILIQ
jgi:glycogen debranching enzyme